MKKLILPFLLILMLTGCKAQTDTVILLPTPIAAPTAAAAASPSPSATPVPDEAPESEAPEPQTPAPSSSPSPTPSPSPDAEPEQPPLLARLADAQGVDLAKLDGEQLVLVACSGSHCKLYAYARGADGLWVKALSASGYLGENGVTDAKREGDKKTPAGCYRLGFAFGHDENPNPDYPFRAITEDSYWVDDPDSEHYNTWVTGTQDKDWNSAENLGRIKTAYALAVVVEYNYGSETVPGKGSAIFLHVGDESTSGCIALPKSDLKALIRWLDDDADPHILIAKE